MRQKYVRLGLPRIDGGFTLVELTIVLVIIALLVGGMVVSLGTQVEQQRSKETQKILEAARDALIGYAAANGRLPCPASASSNGVESFCTNTSGACGSTVIPTLIPLVTPPSHGRCSNPYDGFLPSVTLSISGVDANGYLTDGWGISSNRVRYSVYSSLNTVDGAINTVTHPFTAQNGIKNATIASISARTPLLSVCNSASGVTRTTSSIPETAYCTPVTTLTNSAVAVIFSMGKNAPTGGVGTDEAANLDSDPAFVSHTPAPANAAGGEFDDLVIWLSPGALFNRMIAAGNLP
jgi:prepilin-type N-terminal cleavage/methylation domain-containing protein